MKKECSTEVNREFKITKRRRVNASLVPENAKANPPLPDFLQRLRAIYAEKVLPVSGADLVAKNRNRY